jgi:hypothetical protein
MRLLSIALVASALVCGGLMADNDTKKKVKSETTDAVTGDRVKVKSESKHEGDGDYKERTKVEVNGKTKAKQKIKSESDGDYKESTKIKGPDGKYQSKTKVDK